MPLSGNKGEWSEIYTLLKLLGEGKVYAGDQNLNKIHDLFYPIIMILREEKEGNYNYELKEQNVVIQTPEGDILLCIEANLFLKEAEKLLYAIRQNNGSFEVPAVEKFMHNIKCYSLKADRKSVLSGKRGGYSVNSGGSWT